jgi:uncharacterized coiled-coil DUF342 family protein
MSRKEEYQEKLQERLNILNAEIDKFHAMAEKAGAEARLEYYEKLDELKDMQLKAIDRLAELKESSDEAWEDLTTGMESAWTIFEDAVKTAISRYK